MRKLFGTDGIRGVAGDFPLAAGTVFIIGQALGPVVGGATPMGEEMARAESRGADGAGVSPAPLPGVVLGGGAGPAHADPTGAARHDPAGG